MALKQQNKTVYPTWASSFWKVLAYDLHTLLGIPLDKNRRPDVGSRILRAVVKAMVEALKRGERIRIVGFGEFRVIEKPSYAKRGEILLGNPMILSKTYIRYPARKKVVFRPCITLRAVMNADDPTYQERRQLSQWEPKS